MVLREKFMEVPRDASDEILGIHGTYYKIYVFRRHCPSSIVVYCLFFSIKNKKYFLFNIEKYVSSL